MSKIKYAGSPDILDEFGIDHDHYPKPKRKKSKKHVKAPRTEFISELHRRLTAGLPDFVDEFGVLDAKTLARKIGVSFQALYGWFNHNRVSKKRLEMIVFLSQQTVKIPVRKEGETPWEPLTRDQLWEFLSR